VIVIHQRQRNSFIKNRKKKSDKKKKQTLVQYVIRTWILIRKNLNPSGNGIWIKILSYAKIVLKKKKLNSTKKGIIVQYVMELLNSSDIILNQNGILKVNYVENAGIEEME